MKNPSVITEVKALRKDVNSLKGETAALRKDVTEIKNTMALRQETDAKFERVFAELMRLRRDTDDLKEMKGIVVEIRTIVQQQSNRMDQYANDAKAVFNNDRIHDGQIRNLQGMADDHEMRIATLEKSGPR